MDMAERDPIETLTGEHEQVPATPAEKAAVASTSNPRRRKVMLGLAAGFLLVGGGWYALHDTSHVSTDNAYVNADSAQVTPLVAAAVVDVPVVNTQFVRRGDVLLRLDGNDARLAFEKAEAAYLKARRQYAQTSATGGSLAAVVNARDADIGQAHAQLAAAQSAFQKAQIDLERRSALAQTGAVSGDELTNVKNAFSAAQSNVALARAAVAQAEAQRGAAQKSYAANQAMIQDASIDLNPDVAAAKA